VIGFWEILGGTALAAAAMAFYYWRAFPALQHEIGHELEEMAAARD
jgi:hypothetical protein